MALATWGACRRPASPGWDTAWSESMWPTTKVDLINQGRSPIIEEDIDELISEMVASGRLSATTDATTAIQQSDVSLICVGTPSRKNGSLDLGYIRAVCEEVGQALASKEGRHVVAIRSTVLPGTVEEVVIPTLEAARPQRADGCGRRSEPGVPA